jgi:hypothetical protein
MEKPMRQSRYTVLIPLVMVGLAVWFSPDAYALEPMGVTIVPREMRLVQAPAVSPQAVGQRLVIAQHTEQKKAVKNEKNPADKTEKMKPEKPDKLKPEKPGKPKAEKPEKPSSDRMANYQCSEYCVVVRQSCEGLAVIQPNINISSIGSKENNEWSRECQNIYTDCLMKCNDDEKKVAWERSKFIERKNKKKGEYLREK